MPAATAIVGKDRPSGRVQQFTFTLASGSIAAAGTEVNTVAVPGVTTDDGCYVTPISAGAPIQAGLIICNARVSAAGVVTFHITNITAGALTPAPTQYCLTIHRGSTMAFAR